MTVQLSAIDEERFGIRTARDNEIMTPDDVSAVLDFCHANQVRLLLTRCPTHQLQTVHRMEQNGFLLMDTLVYYARSLTLPIPVAAHPVRIAQLDEVETISRLAEVSFRDYNGHYRADERLDRAKCNEIYPSWAYRSVVSRQVADEVLVVEQNRGVVGFVTLRLNDPQEGEVPLYGVSPDVQGQGIGGSLIIGALQAFHSRGAERMVISTQITNTASQKVWIRLGFEPSESFYTFHKWFD